MSFLDTLFIDTHSIRAVDGLIVTGAIRGLFAPGERRGDDDAPGGRDGELGAELPLAAYVIEIPIRILGASRGERNDNIINLGNLIGGKAGNGLVQMSRRIATGTGGDYAEAFAKGRYLTGLTFDVVNPYTGASTLQYKNLSGAWNPGTGVFDYP